MIEVVEKKRRQGQKKADGKTAVPKPVCPKCGEICVRTYTRGNEERKRAYIGSGWMCPSKTCDYIIKDFVELTEEEPGFIKLSKCDQKQFIYNLQQALEDYLRDPADDKKLGRYEGIAKVAGFMDLTNREVLEAEEEVHRKLEKERQAET